jgi:hypothetical protein
MNATKALAVALLFAIPAAWAADEPKTEPNTGNGNACAWIRTIDDWRRLDDRNLVVWVSRREVYHVELSMPLFDLNGAAAIGFIDHNRDGRLCGFGMDQVVVPHSPVFGSSTIANITRLDPAGLQALETKYKVRLTPKPKKAAKSDGADASKKNE